MEKERNTPSIRFKGFTDPWEQCKLGEIANKVTTKNAEGKYTETFTNSAEYGIISQDDFFDYGISNPENINGYYIIENDDFVYNPRISKSAPVGPINRNKLGRIGVMSPLYLAFKVTNVDESFLEWYFKSTYWHPFMYFNGDTGARSDRFSIKDKVFFEMPIPLPHIEEQKQIGSTLENIDSLITLHQRKLDQEKKLKKYLLQNMFPREGENVPRIRFPGFTDPWEQRKLSSLFESFVDGDWIEAKDQSDSGIRLIQTGNVGITNFIDKPDNKKWISEDTFESLHCEEIYPGDILISRLPEPAGRACIVPVTGTRMITAVDCTIARTSSNNSAEFIVQYLSTPDYFKWVNSCLAGGTRQRISRSMLSDCNIMIPPTLDEQDKIGRTFSLLDNLITLHQRKLESLKELKKGLLQKMFV